MGRSGLHYRKLLQSFFPTGYFWSRAENSEITKILRAIAQEFSRIEERAENLIDEQDVRITDELITEHEKDYNLSSAEDGISKTTTKRRNDLHAALLTVGQQNPDYYIELGETLGYEVTVETYKPFWCGVGVCGDQVGDQNNIFFWTIRIDVDSVDEPSEVNLTKLINKINSTKPTHTIALYNYYDAEFGRGFGRAFDRFPSYDNSWGLVEEKELDFGREYSNAFANAYDYDGVNYTGAFGKEFGIDHDRYSGGAFSDAFGPRTYVGAFGAGFSTEYSNGTMVRNDFNVPM
jgi:uncharacterized protein YmfQ (DUF2313 family)